jgi:3-oxoacyl-[acyl-carrier-protein] synthase-3
MTHPQRIHFARLIATGSALPERVVSNEELATQFATSDEWIRDKIGIFERRYAADNQGVSDLATQAAQKALAQAAMSATDLDAIILATATPEYSAPGSGVLVQNKLGCRTIPAFDVHNTSPGFLFSLDLADGLLQSGRYQTLLVIGAEVHSRVLDFSDAGRMMSVIFGDGAGCVILQSHPAPIGLIDFVLHSDGQHFNKLWHPGKEAFGSPKDTTPQMDGRFVFENAVNCMTTAVQELLTRNKLKTDDIDLALSHQANLRIIKAIQTQLQLTEAQVPHNIERVGNTSSASIPILMDELMRAGTIKPGMQIVLMSFGSGFSWGAALLRT